MKLAYAFVTTLVCINSVIGSLYGDELFDERRRSLVEVDHHTHRPVEKHRHPTVNPIAQAINEFVVAPEDEEAFAQCESLHGATSGRVKLMKGMVKSLITLSKGLDERYQEYYQWNDHYQHEHHPFDEHYKNWCEASQHSMEKDLESLKRHLKDAFTVLKVMGLEQDEFHTWDLHRHHERDEEEE